jgi:hypothetical protein
MNVLLNSPTEDIELKFIMPPGCKYVTFDRLKILQVNASIIDNTPSDLAELIKTNRLIVIDNEGNVHKDHNMIIRTWKEIINNKRVMRALLSYYATN